VPAASAPGKVILFGEHFVVKGAPSIATALCKRVRVTITTGKSRVRIISPRAGIDVELPVDEVARAKGILAPIAGIVNYMNEKYGLRTTPMVVRVESEIPVGAGLGSSAAFSAAFSLAYAAFHGLRLSTEEISEASFVGEKIAHGNPSGIDTAIAVYGGSILYRRGLKPQRLNIRLPAGYRLVIANSGIERSTRQVVERVLSRADATWPVARHIYKAAEELVAEAVKAFERGDGRLLGELMDINHGLLNAMGASSESLERLVHAARRAGAIGAKLTGAGWGGIKTL
jgi:mevalonate kinase